MTDKISNFTGERKHLDETTQNQIESPMGHDLKEVRTPNSNQKDSTTDIRILDTSGETSVNTSEVIGLPSHELNHVIQQAKPRAVTWNTPTRRLLVPTPAKHKEQPSVVRSTSDGPSKFMSSKHENTESPKDGIINISLAPDIHRGMIQRKGDELQTKATEYAVKETAQTESKASKSPKIAQADPEAIAHMVYKMILKDLVLEQERQC